MYYYKTSAQKIRHERTKSKCKTIKMAGVIDGEGIESDKAQDVKLKSKKKQCEDHEDTMVYEKSTSTYYSNDEEVFDSDHQ